MRERHRMAALLAAAIAAAATQAGCQPVPVRAGATSIADIGVPARAAPAVNLVAIGVAAASEPIVLRTTGVRVARGSSVTIGVAGPGVEPGTALAVLGPGLTTRLLRFATTSGGGQEPLPAAVLALDVAPTVTPGLYTLLAARAGEYSVFAGAVEVE